MNIDRYQFPPTEVKLPTVEKYCIHKIPNEFSEVCSGTMYLNYHEDPVDSLGQDRLLDFAFTNGFTEV